MRGLGVDQCLGLQVPEPPREEAPENSSCLRLPRRFASERARRSELPAGERGSGLGGRSGGGGFRCSPPRGAFR